jgi:sRNA-binding carbon storage regulator CsrA
MLVITRKTNEVTLIDDRVQVVPTKISETEVTVNINAVEPFQAAASSPNRVRFSALRTSFEFVLKPEESIHIGEDITVIFIVARTVGQNSEPQARIGFLGPHKTKLCAKDACGSIVTETEL